MDEITLSRTEFKALASDTRTEIIKFLDERNYTLSELSKKMALAAPTIKQHLGLLEQAGLIQCKDEGRKWKYYCLTRKGRKILQPEQSGNVFIVLALSIIGMGAVLYILIERLGIGSAGRAINAKELAGDEARSLATETLPAADASMRAAAQFNGLIPLAIIGIIFASLTAIFVINALKKR